MVYKIFSILFVCFLGTLFYVSTAADEENQTLRLIQMVFRHGDKNPESAYPNDPYNDESLWSGGWNHITEKGKRRMYDLGNYIRQRYSNFLSKEYSAEEIYATSSDKDRTIISAMALLAGLFKDENLESHWNPELKWEPIPIRTIEKAYDRYLEVTEPCPRMDELFKRLMSTSEFARNFLTENEEMLDYLRNYTGITGSDVYELTNAVNTLQIEAEQNLELQQWTKPILEYKPLTGFTMNAHRAFHNSSKMWPSFRSGPLAQIIIKNMDDFIQKDAEGKPGKKLILFSAHDRTLVDIMLSLNIYHPHVQQPPFYGSTLIFETHENQNNNYYIQVLYKNDSSPSPYKLQIPNCEIRCPIGDFKTIAHSFIPEDWRKECNTDN